MSTARLFRWSGLSLMVGGILLAVHYVTHPGGETAQYTLQPLWAFAHWVGGIAGLLIVFGLMGVYAYEWQKTGLPGLIGFVLAVVGTSLNASANVIFGALMQPVIAATAPALLDPTSPLMLSAAKPGLVITYIPLLLGYLLLGWATLRSRMLPRLGSWLVMLALPLGVIALASVGTSAQGVLQMLAGIIPGLGLLIWGYALWSGRIQSAAATA